MGLIQTLNVTPNIVNNVEIGPKRNVQTLGETNVVKRPKKSATKILDLSKYPMLKMNASPRKKRDVRSIGKNEAQERRFGSKVQQLVNGTMHHNVLQLLNTEPNKRNILNAPKFHINIAIE